MSESKIIVRCAMQKTSDLVVICPHDWTILRLKQHLRDVCENEPSPNRQKLIYAGQCLKDEDLVGGVLRPELVSDPKAAHTFHLVYTPTVEQIKKEQEAKPQLRQRRAPVSIPPTPAANLASSSPPNAFWPGFPMAGTNGQAQQQQWMQAQQQMYNDYMANYANYINQVYGAFYGSGTFINPAMSVSPIASTEPVPPQEVAPEPQIPAAQPAAVPEAAMNAQGGFDEDDMRDRDWLDWIYVGSRAGLLVMILYFYSSIERFFLVMLCCLFFYGIQAGWFGLRGQQPPDQPPAEEEPQEPAAIEESSASEDNEESPATVDRNEEAVTGAEDTRSPWEVFSVTCYTFITTFFTSMIPERPPPVNVN